VEAVCFLCVDMVLRPEPGETRNICIDVTFGPESGETVMRVEVDLKGWNWEGGSVGVGRASRQARYRACRRTGGPPRLALRGRGLRTS
jgi:hypothetical protein